MKRLSATEAISPAIDHVNRMLDPRSNWRLLLKVCAVAFFAQMGGFNFSVPPNAMPHSPSSSPATIPVFFHAVVFAAILLLFAAALAFFYLGSRLQFVLFDVVLNRQTMIGPSWRRFAPLTWRWMGLKLLVFLAMLLCLLPILVPLVFHFIRSMPAAGSVPHAVLGSFFATFFAFLGIIFFLVILLGSAYCLLADFGLPLIALENASISATVRRVWLLVRAEPGQFALYLVFRFLLVFAGVIACEFTIAITLLILAIPLGGTSLALWLALRHSSATGHLLMIAGWVVAALLSLCAIILLAVTSFGYLLTFTQAYAIYFLADRYPLLRETLDPTPGRPFTPPPPLPGPDEPGNDPGPGFPMDPVPA